MKCPDDKTEMEEGAFYNAYWVSGPKSIMVGGFSLTRRTKYATTYRCPKCGKLEFYTQPGN